MRLIRKDPGPDQHTTAYCSTINVTPTVVFVRRCSHTTHNSVTQARSTPYSTLTLTDTISRHTLQTHKVRLNHTHQHTHSFSALRLRLVIHAHAVSGSVVIHAHALRVYVCVCFMSSPSRRPIASPPSRNSHPPSTSSSNTHTPTWSRRCRESRLQHAAAGRVLAGYDPATRQIACAPCRQ